MLNVSKGVISYGRWTESKAVSDYCFMAAASASASASLNNL